MPRMIDLEAAGITPQALLEATWAAMTPFLPFLGMALALFFGFWAVRQVIVTLTSAAGAISNRQRADMSLPLSLRSGGMQSDLYGSVLGDARAWQARQKNSRVMKGYEQSLRDEAMFAGVVPHRPMNLFKSLVSGGSRRDAQHAASLLERANAQRQKAGEAVVQQRMTSIVGKPAAVLGPPAPTSDAGIPLGDLLATLPGGAGNVFDANGNPKPSAAGLRSMGQRHKQKLRSIRGGKSKTDEKVAE